MRMPLIFTGTWRFLRLHSPSDCTMGVACLTFGCLLSSSIISS